MKITQNEIEQRILNNFPDANFEILEYNGINKPFSIKCLKCGKINSVQHCGSFLRRQNFCDCSKKTRAISRIEECEKICNNRDDLTFVEKKYRKQSRKWEAHILCHKCNQIFIKDAQSFLVRSECPYCNKKHNIVNAISFNKMIPDDYTLISDYVNTETKVLIRHNCGFIWNVKPHTFIAKINTGYKGCPQCNHKRSRGEMNIATWLENNHINFIEEQIFSWSSNSKFRYDFYVPDYNLIIEYHGEPHYKEVAFFHDTLEQRQEHDRIKEKEARENGFNYLIIPYTDFKNIETILTDWFNDYSERK